MSGLSPSFWWFLARRSITPSLRSCSMLSMLFYVWACLLVPTCQFCHSGRRVAKGASVFTLRER